MYNANVSLCIAIHSVLLDRVIESHKEMLGKRSAFHKYICMITIDIKVANSAYKQYT